MAINIDVWGAGPTMEAIAILQMGDYFADTGSPALVKSHAVRTSVQHAVVTGGFDANAERSASLADCD